MIKINAEIIPAYKFNHDFTVESVYIGENVKQIQQCAFFRCINLTSIIFDQSSNLKSIQTNAFYNCLSLESIDLPDSIVELEEEIFHRCYNIKHIKLPKYLKCIRSLTFDHCKSLEKIYIPSQIETIEYEAFSNCHSLKDVQMSRYTYDKIFKDIPMIFTSCHDDLKINIYEDSSNK